jgi:hypothetical protein
VRALVLLLALAACKDNKAPAPVPTPTPTPTPTTPTPSAKPTGHGITVTPKGGDFELGDGKFTVVFPDEPKLEVDPADGTITAEGGAGINVYTLSIISGDEIEGQQHELPLVIGGIFEGLEGKEAKQTPYPPHGIRFEGSAKDGDDGWQVVGWTLAQPATKRIYVLMFQLPNDRSFTRQQAEVVATSMKLI